MTLLAVTGSIEASLIACGRPAMNPHDSTTDAEGIASPNHESPGAQVGNGPEPKQSLFSSEEERPSKNRRRAELIEKKFSTGLTATEDAELERLQEDMDRYLDATWPLPFDILEDIRECARREGLIPPAHPQ
jgi:hypothetical protein